MIASYDHDRHPENPMTTKAPETIIVNTARVACDGGGGVLGHPKVYLQIGKEGYVECGYCDRRFELAKDADKAHAGGAH
jgi:uncharacterized Zn-finger protein